MPNCSSSAWCEQATTWSDLPAPPRPMRPQVERGYLQRLRCFKDGFDPDASNLDEAIGYTFAAAGFFYQARPPCHPRITTSALPTQPYHPSPTTPALPPMPIAPALPPQSTTHSDHPALTLHSTADHERLRAALPTQPRLPPAHYRRVLPPLADLHDLLLDIIESYIVI